MTSNAQLNNLLLSYPLVIFAKRLVTVAADHIFIYIYSLYYQAIFLSLKNSFLSGSGEELMGPHPQLRIL